MERLTKQKIRNKIRENYDVSNFTPGTCISGILNVIFNYDDEIKAEKTLLRNGFIEDRGYCVLTSKGYNWI